MQGVSQLIKKFPALPFFEMLVMVAGKGLCSSSCATAQRRE